MTGDKPDPRLRTPMQWRPGPGVGFTTGTAWEAPQPDSMTVSVAGEESDSGSLLNLYRRLIHLRRDNEALATGRLVPLSTSSPHVAAYLRRAGNHAVLVVANLGEVAAHVSINSEKGALAPGRYTVRNLVGGPDGAALRVTSGGQLQAYVPVAGMIGSRQSLVLELTRRN